MEHKVVLQPEDVLENIRYQAVDVETFFSFSSKGKINDYYVQTLKHIVTDLVVLPVERKVAGLEPISDEEQEVLPEVLVEVSSMLSTLFEKDQRQVEKDLEFLILNFPTQDVQQARKLKHQNLLN